jgi:hypothetical protein
VRSETYQLVDVEARNLEHPRTFEILPHKERASLAVGDLAQLCFDDKERMWVEVTDVRRDCGHVSYYGKLRNEPLFVKVRVSEVIRFQPRHVFKIEKSVSQPNPNKETSTRKANDFS